MNSSSASSAGDRGALLSYLLFETELGWAVVTRSQKGLLHLLLPQPSPEEALKTLSTLPSALVEDRAAFGDLPHRLAQSLAGKPVPFADPLDLSSATPFQRSVWEVVRAIPWGETRSYAWVAERLGRPRAARAVGQALARNPLPIIIPCQRVIRSDGRLGGFSGGLALKRRLLEREATG